MNSNNSDVAFIDSHVQGTSYIRGENRDDYPLVHLAGTIRSSPVV